MITLSFESTCALPVKCPVGIDPNLDFHLLFAVFCTAHRWNISDAGPVMS
jgi:hypothetical protein